MKKFTNEVVDTDNPDGWDGDIINLFLQRYSCYIEAFKKNSICLTIGPCYFYNNTYHSDKRNSGCFLAFRIRLFPLGYTYSKSIKEYTYQEFFTHKMGEISKDASGYVITKYPLQDLLLERFLNKYLHKSISLQKRGKDPRLAIRESAGDVIRSLIHASRYQNEIKHTLRGVNLEYLFLLIVAVIIALHVYWRLRRLGIL